MGVNMNFDILNISRLAQKLAADEIGEGRAAIFLILGNLLYILFAFVAVYVLEFGISKSIDVAIAEAVFAAAIVTFGVRACYKAYSGNKFVLAYIVMSVPALIYSTILSWAINWGLLYAVGRYGATTSFTSEAAADASMAIASRVLEFGSAVSATVGLLSFFYFVWIGLRKAGRTVSNLEKEAR